MKLLLLLVLLPVWPLTSSEETMEDKIEELLKKISLLKTSLEGLEARSRHSAIETIELTALVDLVVEIEREVEEEIT